ncbi:cytochrome b N-terminal domain-containing protein [Roseateles oligotrophus]|uniref:Cytochrome b N-terminal domain-containing protein n=1 Tax=Roseateles oligotrophus TaxID=1769250 RepID=A0ABT2Y9S6_9BURK|nr:cytochrome b N-terminal domain-containing protein [Roseateles oligotrophus]MCV2367056.1 cytochrome b N-terminal domain-containing protein [Roseateles oligotrophus]
MIQRLQALLQACFMRVEALFNRAFGDRLNPLYHLGSIGFLLFWIVAGSGLYLYAFFETGVAGAHASVEALTHGQWWAGGILRSLHRYASDALVLVMCLHMLRNFAFDRLRGFRWFSWVSGVALIWLVYLSGINGYILPWDRLAQFVVVAVFEWLDALPGFGGALMRNFIYASSVNDRLFSLLAFMHIGVPLLLLLLLFVHIQRVPKAKTLPPRSIAASLGLTLLALSLWQPVLSQGGAADLSLAAGSLALDWFYLAMLPLFYSWPLKLVWALAVAGSLLLLLLPWLPMKRRGSKPAAHQILLHPAEQRLTVQGGETILEAGLRAGLALPFECRNGACGVCVCTVLQGRVEQGPYQPQVLSEAMRAKGQVLMCCAKPLGDLEIELDAAADSAAALRPQIQRARVERLEHLSADLVRLRLGLLDQATIAFKGGQYINILLADGQRRAFSFANAPQHNDHIELHVRRIPGGRFTGQVFTQMQVGDELRFEGPLGDFSLREGELPFLFVAGATGFAPIKSIVEDAFARGLTRPMWLYWGVRRQADLYALDLARQWQAERPNFHFVPVLSEPDAAIPWSGRTGLVHQAMLDDFPDLRGFEVYLCGSVKMVDVAAPAFIERGLSEGLCFTDAFRPALRANSGP